MTQDLGQVTSVYNNLGQDITRMYNNRNEIIWEKNNVIYDESDYRNQYFTIEALNTGYVSLSTECGGFISYNLNNTGWVKYNNTLLNSGDTLKIKYIPETNRYGSRLMHIKTHRDPYEDVDDNFKYNVYGNILSLRYGDDFRNYNSITDYNFSHMFYELNDGEGVINAGNLILPSGELSTNCFMSMFGYCYYMAKAPLLPAIHISQNCYSGMFECCYRLKYIECYAEDEVQGSFWNFGNEISSNGILVKKANSNINWNHKIPSGWKIINL